MNKYTVSAWLTNNDIRTRVNTFELNTSKEVKSFVWWIIHQHKKHGFTYLPVIRKDVNTFDKHMPLSYMENRLLSVCLYNTGNIETSEILNIYVERNDPQDKETLR